MGSPKDKIEEIDPIDRLNTIKRSWNLTHQKIGSRTIGVIIFKIQQIDHNTSSHWHTCVHIIMLKKQVLIVWM